MRLLPVTRLSRYSLLVTVLGDILEEFPARHELHHQTQRRHRLVDADEVNDVRRSDLGQQHYLTQNLPHITHGMVSCYGSNRTITTTSISIISITITSSQTNQTATEQFACFLLLALLNTCLRVSNHQMAS